MEQSFTAHMPLLTATNAFRLGRRCWSSPQWHCLHHICTIWPAHPRCAMWPCYCWASCVLLCISASNWRRRRYTSRWSVSCHQRQIPREQRRQQCHPPSVSTQDETGPVTSVCSHYTHTNTQPFTAVFLGLPGWTSARRKSSSGLCGAREDNRGRHTDSDHPDSGWAPLRLD